MLNTGVTTDGCGRLFVADYNNECIQMFDVSNGSYMGCLMLDFGYPDKIRWCENTSSLICTRRLEDESWFVKVLDVQYPSFTNN